MSAGLRVLRGPDWAGGDRDGGEGHLGTVVSVGGEATCDVLWDNGDRSMCRIGKLGKFDLRIFDNATVGVSHSQILCDGCESRDIAGMKWTCAQCKQCNLCSLCYVTDKHDLAHEFTRYDTPTSKGVKVKKRSASLKIRAMGLFPGAHVKRGVNWNSENVDGGGKVGQILSMTNNSSDPSTRNMVRVKWPTGQVVDHRVGYQGKVDIQYTEESPGTYYYKEHLPCLDAGDVQTSAAAEPDTLKEGDHVCIEVPASALKAMQSGRSGWTAGMTNCIGKVGVIKGFTPTGDATVEFGGLRFRFFQGALKKIPNLSVGDVVRVRDDVEKVKVLQEGHGEWRDDMKQILGKCGRVVKKDSDGDVLVAFGHKTWLLNAACCTPARGQKVFELSASDGDVSPEVSVSDMHGDLMKMLAAVMMKQVLSDAVTVNPDALYQAIGQGNAGAVTSMVKKAPKLLNMQHKGVTPLILASHEGQTDVVKALLDMKADTSLTDGKGHTALHAALIGKKERTAQLLLERGANAKGSNNANRTALHFAAFANLHNVMPDLVRRGCNVNAKDAAGDTALHDAIEKNNREAMQIMLRAAKIDLTIANGKGFNPLQLAALRGNPFACEVILKRDKAVVNVAKSSDNFAPLHIAAVNDHVECARVLLQGGANINVKGENGTTPLHLACHEAYLRTVELLMEKNADPNVKDANGNTPLHLAVAVDKMGDEQKLLAALLGMRTRNDDEARVRVACLLLKNNAFVDAKNNNGRTPLEVAKTPTIRQALQLFIRQNQGSIRRSSGSESPRGARLGATTLLDMQLPCAKCMGKMADITLKPCGHKILCRTCCLTTQICPLCETVIQRRVAEERVDLDEVCKMQ